MVAGARWIAGGPPALRLAWWLMAYANVMLCATYFLGLSFAPFGDVHGLIGDLPYTMPLAVVTTSLGFALYVRTIAAASRAFVPLVADRASARRFTITAYLSIGIGAVIAGAFNPDGAMLVVVSAAAESFGGQSGFLYVTHIATRMRERGTVALTGVAPGLPRSNAWIVAGVACAILWIAVLGPGLPRGR